MAITAVVNRFARARARALVKRLGSLGAALADCESRRQDCRTLKEAEELHATMDVLLLALRGTITL